MRELVVVVSDLYLSRETPEQPLPPGVALPGLQQVTRFARREKVTDGWRAWVARWFAGAQADAAPATVAALAFAPPAHGLEPLAQGLELATHRPQLATATAGDESPAHSSGRATVWIATPVHLLAGLSSVHLDRRSLLRLNDAERTALADEFQRIFHDSGFSLVPLDSGDFLLLGPQLPLGEESDPARLLGDNVAEARRGSSSDPALRRLSAEIEMWLYDHPVNEVRRRRGELPVTGLWLWGGGPAPEPHPVAARQLNETSSSDMAFGRDAFVEGLWKSKGAKVASVPPQLTQVFSYPHAQRALLVIEIGSMLHSAPTWTFFDALAHLDRVFIHPAVEALHAGSLERLVLLANDQQLTLRSRDRFKVWRRMPAGLSGLQ